MTESFYDVLGVPADASDDEIRRAYREKLKETHPDVSDDPDAGIDTKRLVEAKEALLDPTERERYDRLGHEAYVGATGSEFDGPGHDVGGTGTSTSVDEDVWTDRDDAGGPTNARAGPWERRARERRARERVETEGSRATNRDGDAGESVSVDEVGTGRATSTADRSRGATDGGFGRAAGVGGPGGGSAGTPGGSPPSWSASRIDVDVQPGDVRNRRPWLTIDESAATVVAAVALYPVLVAGAVLPSFPLSVNVVVGLCTVAVIAALQSMPGVGMVVFGSWALGGSVGLLAAGISPLSLIGVVVIGATWFPLGLTLLTYNTLQF